MSLPHASWAEVYDAVYETSYGSAYHELTRQTLEHIQRAAAPPARVVDFGAGTGRLAIPLAQLGYRVTAVESCPPMLVHLLSQAGELPIHPAACRMQDFASQEKFDLALCVFTVLSYLLDEDSLQSSLQAAADALRPGGLFLLEIPLRSLFQSDHIHTREIDRQVSLQDLGGGRFLYRESTTLFRSSGDIHYADEFEIRCWRVQQVKSVLEGCGFAIQADLSADFFRWGGKYLLLQKSG